jgi:hypothetical protein
MQITAITLVAASLLTAGAAAASDRFTDLDYMKASRCSGLAAGLNAADAASLSALVKAEGRNRVDLVLTRGQSEFDRAKRQARSADNKDRLTAELTSACAAYTGAGRDVAAAGAAKDTSVR